VRATRWRKSRGPRVVSSVPTSHVPTGGTISRCFKYRAQDRYPYGDKAFDLVVSYYDKTHALVDEHRPLFDDCVEIETTGLDDDEATRRTIARVGVGRDDVLPPRTRACNCHTG